MIEKIKKNKFLMYLLILIIGLILVLIVRTAYAYLMADIGLGKTVNINSSSGSLDKLEFIPGEPLNIAATNTSLKENGTNVVSTSKPKVSLIANSTNNTATYNYYVYFKMTSNFIYTVNDTTPELMLTITDGAGTQITNIAGLVYKTFGGVSGFDVTNKNGTFPVSLTSSITSTSATTATLQEWTFTLTYLNLNSDQSGNIGKKVTNEILIQKDKIV